MSLERQAHKPEVNDQASSRPTLVESHDPIQNMKDLLSITRSKAHEGTASLDDLATADIYASQGTKTSDQQRSSKDQADSTVAPHDNNHPQADSIERPTAKNHSEQSPEQAHLLDWADSNLKEPQLSQFKKDMTDFETRSKRDGLDPKEVTQTYKQIERLTDAAGDKPLTEVQRQQLTEQVMHQSANPTGIDQGTHNTCSVNSVETRTYTRTPSDAARLVADVALTGRYTAADGTEVKIDPQPHDESLSGKNVDGFRSHASEIFQVTAVNLYYAKENAKNGTDIHYEQVDPVKGDPGDTGERLMDYSKKPPQELKDKDNNDAPIRQPNLKDADIAAVSNAITGKNESDVLIEAADNGSDETKGDAKGVIKVNNETELKNKLKELKDKHELPIIVTVNTFNEPFNTDAMSSASGGFGGGHAVTITDYDEKTGNVCIDNSWGKDADHGKNNPVSAHELFNAMQKPEDVQKSIQAEVDANKKNGIDDPAKDLELLRYKQRDDDHVLGTDVVKKAMEDTQKRWEKGGVSEQEKDKERGELNALINNLPLDDRTNLLRQEHAAKITSDGQYENQLALLGIDMLHPDQYDPVTDQVKTDYESALSDLSDDRQKSAIGQVDKVKSAIANPNELPPVEQEFLAWLHQNNEV